MRISAVIPVYNRAHMLRRALDSVFAQTSPADEVIVVDDGSNDRGAELVAQSYPQAILMRQPNRGVSAARNAAIDRASSDWIALLDSDDEWLPDKLAQVRSAARDHPEQMLFHSDEIWIRNGRRVNPMHKHRKYGGLIFAHCLPICVISPSAAVIRKSLLTEVGHFDETLPACEDYDLWLRICHRHPVHYIDRPLIRKYGGHSDQLSRQYWGMDRFRIRALDKLIQSQQLDPEQFSLAADTLEKKLKILLNGARKHGNLQLIAEFSPLLARYTHPGLKC